MPGVSPRTQEEIELDAQASASSQNSSERVPPLDLGPTATGTNKNGIDLESPLLKSGAGEVGNKQLSDVETKHVADTPSTKYSKFLEEAKLTEDEITGAGIDVAALKQFLEPKNYQTLLELFHLDQLAVKALLFVFLDARGIEPKFKADKNFRCCDIFSKLRQCLGSRVWVHGEGVPFKSTSDIRLAHGFTAFAEGTGTIVKRVWTALLTAFLAGDVHDYYQYPDQRYGTTLTDILFFSQSDKEQFLATHLTSLRIWPILVGMPVLWGIIKGFMQAYKADGLDDDAISALEERLKKHQPDAFRDTLPWIFPCNPKQDDLDNTRRALLWNNNLTHEQRRKLFDGLVDFTKKSTKLAQLAAIETLATIANGIHPKDIKRLVQEGTSDDIILAILDTQARAIQELMQLRPFHLEEKESEIDQKTRYQKYLKPLIRFLTVNYLLWEMGHANFSFLHIAFWLFKIGVFYIKSKFAYVLYSGMSKIIERYYARKACEADGKLWSYARALDNYICGVCVDMDKVSLANVGDMEKCFPDFLRTPRTVQEFETVFGRIKSTDNIKALSFGGQCSRNSTSPFLREVLPKVKDRLNITKATFNARTRSDKLKDPDDLRLVSSFLKDTFIEELSFAYQYLRDDAMVAWAESLPFLPTLRVLNLSYNSFGKRGMAALAIALKKMPNLEELNFEDCEFDSSIAEELAKGLPDLKNLKKLDLTWNQIGDKGLIAISKNLPKKIKTLWLGANDISNDGLKALAQELPRLDLEELDIFANQVGKEGFAALGQVLERSKLNTLMCAGNNMGDDGFIGLTSGLRSDLRVLYVENCNISSAGIRAWSENLADSNIEHLRLSDNPLKDEGVFYVAEALPKSRLKYLYLNEVGMKDAGAKKIGESLQKGAKLIKLDISRNKIGTIGAEGLASGLRKSLLQELHLSDTAIGDKGFSAVVQELPYKRLRLLDASATDLTAKGLKIFVNVAQDCTSLEVLNLSANDLRGEGVQVLSEILPRLVALNELRLAVINADAADTKVLAPALPKALKVFIFSNNHIQDDGVEEFAKVLRNLKEIEEVDLRLTKMGDQGATKIASAIIRAPEFSLATEAIDAARVRYSAQLLVPKLKDLELGNNNIGIKGAEAVCRAVQSAPVLDPISFEFNYKNALPKNASSFNFDTCIPLNASRRTEPLWPAIATLIAVSTILLVEQPVEDHKKVVEGSETSGPEREITVDMLVTAIFSKINNTYISHRFSEGQYADAITKLVLPLFKDIILNLNLENTVIINVFVSAIKKHAGTKRNYYVATFLGACLSSGITPETINKNHKMITEEVQTTLKLSSVTPALENTKCAFRS